MIKKVIVLCVLLCLCYVGLYVWNSSAGGYWLRPQQDGTVDFYSIDVPTKIYWQPRFGQVAAHTTDLLGMVFYPCIKVDQFLFHPTIDMLADGAAKKLYDAYSQDDIHPVHRIELPSLLP